MEFYHTGQITKDLAKKSFAAGVAMVMPGGDAPLFAMSGLAKKKTALQVEHGYWSKQYDYVDVTVDNGGDVAAIDTTITLGTATNYNAPSYPINAGNDRDGVALPTRGDIADIDRVIVGMVLRFQAPITVQGSGGYNAPENMLITAVNTATGELTVIRGFDGTTAQTIPNGSKLMQIGNAQEEGSSRPVSQAIIPIRHLNYTQIFRNSWDVSGTLRGTALAYGEQPEANNKQDCAHYHARDIELATFFSRKSMGMRNNKPFHTMDGIEALIEKYAPAHLVGAGATTTYTQLQELLNPLLNYKSSKSTNGHRRTIYCGGQARHVLSEIGRLSGSYQLVDGQTSFGLMFTTFKTTRGTFDIVEHPLFNTNDRLASMAVVADLSSFDYAYLSGRDTLHEQYNKAGGLTDGTDAYGGVLTTELTVELQNPFSWGIIYGLTAAAADA